MSSNEDFQVFKRNVLIALAGVAGLAIAYYVGSLSLALLLILGVLVGINTLYFIRGYFPGRIVGLALATICIIPFAYFNYLWLSVAILVSVIIGQGYLMYNGKAEYTQLRKGSDLNGSFF